MNAPNKLEVPQEVIQFQLNGNTVEAFDGESILNAAKRAGVAIPHLCYKDGLRADGNCRACVVEVKGERVLAPSCCRAATSGMEVTTNSERAEQSQKLVLELLLSDMPETAYRPDSELDFWVKKMQVTVRKPLVTKGLKPDGTPAARAHAPLADLSHPAIAVNLDACIQCTRCVRACRE